MEKKIKKIPHFKKIEDGFYEKEVFISEDGKEFETQKRCEEYEIAQKYFKIKTKESDFTFPFNKGTWYFPNSEEEIEILKKHLELNKSSIRGNIVPNSWVFVETEYDTYYDKCFYSAVTLQQISEDFHDLIERLNG